MAGATGAARTTNMNLGSDRIGAPPVSRSQLPHERERTGVVRQHRVLLDEGQNFQHDAIHSVTDSELSN
jgi:hypothetical protein